MTDAPDAVWNASEIFQRGLANPNALTPDERFVYLLVLLETNVAMSGWDAFFRYLNSMKHYTELKNGLASIGATACLTILAAYEAEVAGFGFPMTSDGIDEMLASNICRNAEPHHDYAQDWSGSEDELWDKVRAYLVTKNVSLSV